MTMMVITMVFIITVLNNGVEIIIVFVIMMAFVY
jgi:hypothetical protein